ncbi:MAG: penicillin-binding protein activator [Mariprofundaceae bacterium]
MNRLYPSSLASAILFALVTLLLSSCASKVILPETPIEHKRTTVIAPAPEALQISQEIAHLLQIAQQDGQVEEALVGLELLQQQSPLPLQEEAYFRRIQLLLENQYPAAWQSAQQALQQYPNHALAPYTHLWLAQWWQQQDSIISPELPLRNAYTDHVIQELSLALQHPRLTQDLKQQVLFFGSENILQASPAQAISWYLSAAHTDIAQQEYWFHVAANALDMSLFKQLHQAAEINPIRDASLYLNFARIQLMTAQMDRLKILDQLMQQDYPFLPLTQKITSWSEGQMQDIYIGVLLPLTGPYARFGNEALNGIRMAAAEQNKSQYIHLYIQDTAQTDQGIIEAYQNLQAKGVNWLIGPLLSQNTALLAEYLQNNLPTISLSQNNALATSSDALFIHNLSKQTQARFMAQYAYTQGQRRIATIHGSNLSEQHEVKAFTQAFTQLGGEVIANLQLQDSGIDHRQELNDLREITDDELLLADLFEDISLFSAETRLDIHLPVGVDALYIASNGKLVSQLAGQLAYVDIRKIPLLGSSRWADGHLLDDKGRNLSSARFIQTKQKLDPALLTSFRDIWGAKEPSQLLTIAYDSTRIITLVGSRLGLHGKRGIAALQDKAGFPSQTGHVSFDQSGIANKEFHVWRIRNKKLIQEH